MRSLESGDCLGGDIVRLNLARWSLSGCDECCCEVDLEAAVSLVVTRLQEKLRGKATVTRCEVVCGRCAG